MNFEKAGLREISSKLNIDTGNTFRTSKFDPIYIVLQIIGSQCIFYSVYLMLVFLVTVCTGNLLTLDVIFDYTLLTFKDTHTFSKLFLYTVYFSMLMTCCFHGFFVLPLLIRRAKLCLDFSATVFFCHFLLCGLPLYLKWWSVVLVGCSLMTILAERKCMEKELEPILLSPGPAGSKERLTNETLFNRFSNFLT